MQRIEVGPRRGGWTVRHGTVEQGPYRTRDLALMVAAVHARHVRAGGLPTRIIVRDGDGRIRAVWPAAADPGPPAVTRPPSGRR